MTPPLWQCFNCPRCGKNVARPVGAETWHPCGLHIHAGGSAIHVWTDAGVIMLNTKETT